MTDIEQARTILTKWGEGATPGPWTVRPDVVSPQQYADPIAASGVPLCFDMSATDATLVVAMTDPALREALDGLLVEAMNAPIITYSSREAAERIAAVIIAIDQRRNA